jgi:5-methylcytosine-specific restriction endonuclease McrA
VQVANYVAASLAQTQSSPFRTVWVEVRALENAPTGKEPAMTIGAHPALVLNADFRPMSYFPLSLLTWQDAVNAVFSERVAVVAEYDVWARSPSTQIRLPSVVALRNYQRAPRRVAFTRFHVFLRDRFTCQYCGKAFASQTLTFEHVIPRSRGGQTCWCNIVTACVPCNTMKANSVHIKPRRQPKEPTFSELLAAKRAFPPGYLHEGWTDYLYWDAQLEA